MKQWRWAWGVSVLLGLLVALQYSRSASLLKDTDTAFLLSKIQERHSPLSWFGGDWPLGNHFYRPVVSLLFELDLGLWGMNPTGFAITNAVLCGLCAVMLFWLARELLDEPIPAAASALLCASWIVGAPWLHWLRVALIGIIAIGVLGVARRKNWKQLLPVAGFGAWAAWECGGIYTLRGGAIDWIPGRTATTMAVFALAAMAGFARWLRLTAPAPPRPPTSQDLPATSSSVQAKIPRHAWIWLAFALLDVFLALGSYEQAVMLPACFLGIEILFRIRGRQTSFRWTAASFGVLALYLGLRWQILPHSASGYQLQQYRSGPDVYLTIFDYIYPSMRDIPRWASLGELGPEPFMLEGLPIAFALVTLPALFWVVRAGLKPGQGQPSWLGTALSGGLILSLAAFLPMAWMKPFPYYNHYHFWPMCIRSLYASGLIGLFGRTVLTAWSLPGLPTPPRPSPAPGSLPHP